MAKEFEKFKKEYTSLKPKIKTFCLENGEKLGKLQHRAASMCKEGESYITSMIVEAREKGNIVGNTVADFSKYKGFQEAVKLFEKSVKEHSETLVAAQAHEAGARDTYNRLSKLRKEMEKQLLKKKVAKDKKEEKEITTIYDEIFQQEGYLKESIAKCAGISKEWVTYEKDKQKTLQELVGRAPSDAANRELQEIWKNELKESLMKKKLQQCLAASKFVHTLCDGALKSFAAKPAEAKKSLADAAKLRDKVKDIHAHYAAIRKAKNHTLTKATDPKELARVEKSIQAMKDAYEDAERTVRGTVTTLRKGGKP